jgi:hypothetical protein
MASVDREQIGEWLSAYIDGELNDEQNAVIERLLREDPKVRRLLEELRATVALVSSLPHHPAPPGIGEDISRHIERDELLGSPDEVPVPTRGRRRIPLGQLATAAMFALIVFGVAWWYMDLGSPSAPTDTLLADAHKPGADELTKELYPSSKARRDSAASRPLLEKGSPASSPGLRAGRGAAAAERATLEQKLAVNVPQEDLLRHPFDNETNTFKISLPSNTTRDLAVYRLTAHLAANGFADIEQRAGKKGDRLGEESFYLKGRVGVNFAADNEQQILVRARPGEVPTLVNTLAGSDGDRDSAVLQVGPVVATGWERTQALTNQIAGLYAKEPREATLSKEGSTPEGEPGHGESEQLRKLMKTLGLGDVRMLAGSAGPDSKDFSPEKELFPDKGKTAREVNGTDLPGPEFAKDKPAEKAAKGDGPAEEPSAADRAVSGARGATGEPHPRSEEKKLDEAEETREKTRHTRSVKASGADEDKGKEDRAAKPKAHTSIIERRMEEIARAAKKRVEEKRPVDSAKSVADKEATFSRPSDEVAPKTPSPERFVTLVIQVAGPPRVAPPERAEDKPTKPPHAAKRPKAEVKADGGKPDNESTNDASR